MEHTFRRLAHQVSHIVGSPISFILAITTILVWLITGPVFHFSDTWQLFINTSTTIITFLMVFLIQNTQNRDAMAMQLKLDELIKAQQGARNKLVNIEELSDEELERLHQEFREVHEHYTKALEERKGKFKIVEKRTITGKGEK